jgi:hypothetical protein
MDMLPDLVYFYNHSAHRSIKTKPAEVTAENEKCMICMIMKP